MDVYIADKFDHGIIIKWEENKFCLIIVCVEKSTFFFKKMFRKIMRTLRVVHILVQG